MSENEIKKLVCTNQSCRNLTEFIAIYNQSNFVDQYIKETGENSEENYNSDYHMFKCASCYEEAVIKIVKGGKSMVRNPNMKSK